jgi:hypothetical protein
VPVVAPVIDYSNVINHSVLGGEFSYKTNFTNLTAKPRFSIRSPRRPRPPVLARRQIRPIRPRA